MSETPNVKRYDLEERTRQFAKDVRLFASRLPKTASNLEDIKQVVRSSGSTGANYIEANESLSRKDFLMRVKISRKESKESVYWLSLINCGASPELENVRITLEKEATELMKILSAIMHKVQKMDGESS